MSELFEQELQANTILRFIYENSKVNAIVVSDEDGYILHLNEAFQHNYGYTIEELRGRHGRVLFTPEDQERLIPEAEIKDVKQHGFARDRNYVVHRNGSLQWTDGESVFAKTNGGAAFIFKIIQNIQEQLVLETFLRDALEFSDKVVSSINDGLLVINQEKRILKVNTCFYRVLGKEETNVEGLNLSQLDDALLTSDRFNRELQKIINEQSVAGQEFEYTLQGNVEKTLLVKARFLEGEHDNARILIVLTDITALKKKQESEKNLRTLVMQAPVGICIVNETTLTVEMVNDAFLVLAGKKRDALESRPYWQALPEAKDFYAPILEKVFQTGIAYQGKEHLVPLLRNGKAENVYVTFVYEPLADEAGAVKRVMILALDVTEQVASRQKIAYAEESARLAIEAAELGVYEVNLQTGEMTTDARFNAIFGFEKPASREAFAAVIHPDDLPIRNKAHDDSLQSGHLQYEARLIPNDKSVHWVRIKGTVLPDKDGAPARLLGVAQDITEQKLFAEELEKQVWDKTKELSATNEELESTIRALKNSNANLEEFAHAASHDLKEPIRKIYTFSDRLKTKLAPRMNGEETQLFNRLEGAAERMKLLVDDLLEYSHVNYRPHQKEPVDLNKKLVLVLDDLELPIREAQATVAIGEMPVVNGYRRQLQQLFQNLIANAVKYRKPDVPPQIRITARTVTGKDVLPDLPEEALHKFFHLIVITDNGIGFEQAHAEQIFKMFHRLHGKTEYSGTGIGLSIVRKVVGNHDGYIWAESSPGRGARFFVLLPAD